MHELALAQQLAGVVTRAAAGRAVCSVQLAIGALRQVVPETLAYAWEFTTKDTALEGAALEVDWKPLIIRCTAGHETEVQGELDMFCPECGEIGEVLSGEQFTVVSIDVT